MDTRLATVVEHIDYLFTCCWPREMQTFKTTDLSEVINLSNDFPSADSTCYGVVKMSDGRFLAFEEGCDYTGHG